MDSHPHLLGQPPPVLLSLLLLGLVQLLLQGVGAVGAHFKIMSANHHKESRPHEMKTRTKTTLRQSQKTSARDTQKSAKDSGDTHHVIGHLAVGKFLASLAVSVLPVLVGPSRLEHLHGLLVFGLVRPPHWPPAIRGADRGNVLILCEHGLPRCIVLFHQPRACVASNRKQRLSVNPGRIAQTNPGIGHEHQQYATRVLQFLAIVFDFFHVRDRAWISCTPVQVQQQQGISHGQKRLSVLGARGAP